MPLNQRRAKIRTIFNQVLDGIEYIHE